MTDEKMAQVGDELIRKISDLLATGYKGSTSAVLIAAEKLASQHKGNLADQLELTIERAELKEYDMIFKEVGLKYKITPIVGEDSFMLMFSSKDRSKYEQAIDLIERARALVNEVPLKEYMDKHLDTKLEMLGPIDEVELSRLRTYANRGEVEYAISYSEDAVVEYTNDDYNLGQIGGYSIVFKATDKKEVKGILEKVYTDYEGVNGRLEREKVFMQLKTYNSAISEINKQNTNFVVVDAMFPDSHMVVLEDEWISYDGSEVIKRSNDRDSKYKHKQEVLDTIQSLSAPLVMSAEEYRDIGKREELIKEAGYFEEFQGPESPDRIGKAKEKVNSLKSERVTPEQKKNVEKENSTDGPKNSKDRDKRKEKERKREERSL